MDDKKFLIVNADDFGLSSAVNRGVVEAYKLGIVTSASLMVRFQGAKDAAAYGRNHPGLGLGLHLDLGEWFYSDGEWLPKYEVVDLTDAKAVLTEVCRQIETFRRLVGRDPTHIDSHQHVHRREPVKTILLQCAEKIKTPVRHFTPDIRYCGDFYGQTTEGYSFPEAIEVDALIKILEGLPPGTTELACHPGYADHLNTAYQKERPLELTALCDSRIQDHIIRLGIKLRSFQGAGLPV
ncbi:MAG: chitooligosaccharide deacetylase [Nitrospinaceae bacterium]|nr:MAG: chitooligosaccharide deacetylase [Nitrospinaceae bacterium]